MSAFDEFAGPIWGRRLRTLALTIALFSTGACRSPEADARGKEAVPVTVDTVKRVDVPIELTAFGVVEAYSTVEVVPQVSGLITQVHFQQGDFVKKGDPLFTIDTRTYRASLAVAQATLTQNQVQEAQAKVEADRYLRLQQEGVASEQDLLKAQSTAAALRATVQVGQAQVQSAAISVNFTKVSSPIDGRTGTVLVQAGNVVQAGAPTPLVVIRAMKPIQVRFSLPQRYLTQIRQRLAVAPLSVRATPKSEGAKTVEGKLTFLENTVDTSIGTLTLRATFDNDSLELWPGATVDAVLVLDVDKGATVAPAAAIQDGQDGSYSFVVEGDKAVQRPVHVSRTTKTQAVVQSGLKPGDVVVTDGQVRLRSGVRVTIKSDAPAPKSTSDAAVGVAP